MMVPMLLFFYFIVTVLAKISSGTPESLPKSGIDQVPTFHDDDFNALEKSQIVEGIRDAQYLASAAYEAASLPFLT